MDIAKRLTEVRESQGLSKTQLAKISGVSQSFISYIEAGKRQPTLDVVQRLCKALGITVSQFLQESDDTNLPPDILQLLENAKKLPPAERKALNEFLKVRLASIEKAPVDLAKFRAAKLKLKANKFARIPLLGASAAGKPMT